MDMGHTEIRMSQDMLEDSSPKRSYLADLSSFVKGGYCREETFSKWKVGLDDVQLETGLLG